MFTVLVEGTEGTCKTTIANKLLKIYPNAKIVHCGIPDKVKPSLTMYNDIFSEAMEEGYETLIFDRGWYSDKVYGTLKRGVSDIRDVEIAAVEALAMANGGGIIYHCFTQGHIGFQRAMKRGETYVTTKQEWKAIDDMFWECLKTSRLLVLHVDNTR